MNNNASKPLFSSPLVNPLKLEHPEPALCFGPLERICQERENCGEAQPQRHRAPTKAESGKKGFESFQFQEGKIGRGGTRPEIVSSAEKIYNEISTTEGARDREPVTNCFAALAGGAMRQ
jgi:hypothetical protein